MKKLIIVLLILGVAGCSYGTKKIKTLMTDPQFTQYKEELDALESAYLGRRITYSEYLEQKRQLDDTYAKDVQAREEIIHSP